MVESRHVERHRITILVAAGAISATLGVGSWSTNARIDDGNTHLDTCIDDVNARIDDVQADIRGLRALIIDAITRDDPAN